jgi:hypothetical protein
VNASSANTMSALLGIDMITDPRFSGYSYAIHGAVWGASCTQVYALKQLTMSSYCLRYIPVDLRRDFLGYIADTCRPFKSGRHSCDCNV